jgi:hypothetical protein
VLIPKSINNDSGIWRCKWVSTLEKKGKPPQVIRTAAKAKFNGSEASDFLLLKSSEKGLRNWPIIIATMRKILTIIYGMLKSNTKFKP